MARIYATSCEKDGKNFYTVPKRLQAQVRGIIEADGYIINDDGNVAKRETYTRVLPPEPVESEVNE